MIGHIDQITNPDHPAKKYRDNAKALSMAYYMANSTERQTEVYGTFKANFLDKLEDPDEKPAIPKAIEPTEKPKDVKNEITDLLEDERDDD